jgi:hypothetical protein
MRYDNNAIKQILAWIFCLDLFMEWSGNLMVNSIVEAVFSHAQRQPERAALFFEGQTIRYGQVVRGH